MLTAAELHREVAHLHNPDRVAVLLAEERHCAELLRLVEGHHLRLDISALKDHIGHNGVDLAYLLSGERGEVGEVKAQIVRLYERTGLMHMVAEDKAQRALEQMRGAVGAGYGLAALGVDADGELIAENDAALEKLAVMHVFSALVFQDVIDLEYHSVRSHHALIGDLAAHLGVHRGAVEHDDGVHALVYLAADLALGDECDDRALALGPVITDKLSLRHFLAELLACPAEIAQRLARLAGADALLFHQLLELRLVNDHSLVGAHLYGEVNGEAVGIIELECIRTGENGLAVRLVLG